ncbi:uncharacterized protein LOC111050391 [Nilaparvata lugens]|uniref:uncharacterized protein LOC111050391 n=1 Tax=Nilaparvata lugens TaxID=108931 RepID=UPI00193E0BDA|nr:uncharacterized protein LOC111050391 [Nilaparvata lugens]
MVALIRNSVILCFVVNGGSALWEEIAGPYDLNFHHVSHCDKKGKIDALIPMKVSKLNRTHFVYSGRIDLGADADDNLKTTGKGTENSRLWGILWKALSLEVPVTYELEDHRGEAIQGGFYSEEIVKTKVPSVFD